MCSEKICTGCKELKEIGNFYKNKLTTDGHSIYCISCTKINSKKYFERKKIKDSKLVNEGIMKNVLLSSLNGTVNKDHVDSLMKVMVTEKMVHNILVELSELKKTFVKDDTLSEIEL